MLSYFYISSVTIFSYCQPNRYKTSALVLQWIVAHITRLFLYYLHFFNQPVYPSASICISTCNKDLQPYVQGSGIGLKEKFVCFSRNPLGFSLVQAAP